MHLYLMSLVALLAIMCWMCVGAEASPAVLSTFRDMQKLRQTVSPERVIRINNVDDIHVVDKDGEGRSIPVCHFVNMNTYNRVAGVGPIALASTALALEHLNSGNGVVVPEVQGLDRTCSTRFTAEFMDTEHNTTVAMSQMIDLLRRETDLPCAFLGTTFSSVAIATSVVTGIEGYAQIGATSSATELDRKDLYPLFSRVGYSSHDFARPLLEFLYTELGVRNFAIVVSDDPAQSAFASGILDAQKEYDELTSTPLIYLPTDAKPSDYQDAVKALALTKFRYFVVFCLPNDILPLMGAAMSKGLAGNGLHTWVQTTASMDRVLRQTFPATSEIAKALKGLLYIATTGALPGIGRYEEFEREMKALWNSTEDMNYLATIWPGLVDGEKDGTLFGRDEGPFQSRVQATIATMMYDSAILAGLGACNTGKTHFDGKEHHEAIFQSGFTGASGFMSLNENTRSRNVSSLSFALYYYTQEKSTGNDGEVVFRKTEAANFTLGSWHVTEKIVFNDGTTNIPSDLPKLVVDENPIRITVLWAGYSMAGMILLSSLLLSLWTAVLARRQVYVVMASQPAFLQMICAGTFLMGSSILPASFDDSRFALSAVDSACMSTPWLFSLGWCIAFSSLFSKTVRVNKIFYNPKCRRVVVRLQDVISPMICMLLGNVTVLLAWTLVDPLQWERRDISEDQFGRVDATVGSCSADHTLHFTIPLLAINTGALIYANYQAFVARKIATEFAESESIARVMSLMLVVIFIAVPVSVIAGDDTSVSFFVYASIVLVVSMSLLMFLFVPKIYHTLLPGNQKNARMKRAIRSSIPSASVSTDDTNQQQTYNYGCDVVEHPKLIAVRLESMEAELKALRSENLKLRARPSSAKSGSETLDSSED